MLWWIEDDYNRVDDIPPEFSEYVGPNGPAVVRVYPNGKTDKGWGEDRFMSKYQAGLFAAHRAIPLRSQTRAQPPFAFVMRSLRLVCIDIDGKNGGLEHAGKLGMLPYTLAERSKSDNGYHLFYFTEEPWDSAVGFAPFKDRIGIQQGVDIRVTGCVFHYPNQRWNHRPIAKLPAHLTQMLTEREQKAEAAIATILKTMESENKDDIYSLQGKLITDLGEPIPLGRRNNTLFAIGGQMKLAGLVDWEQAIRKRAAQVKLDPIEIDKLVHNIEKYGATA